MNDSRKPCESRLEELSLLAAGCLTDQEERELREHLNTCVGCRVRFEELATVGALVRAAQPPVDASSLRRIARVELDSAPADRTVESVGRLGWRTALLAAAALVLFAVVARIAFRSGEHRPVQPREVVQGSPPTVPEEVAESRMPTLVTLRRAAAESDESLDRLLASYSETLRPEPLLSQSLLQDLGK